MNGFARRRATAPWVALAGLLAVGGPLFLCMPLWADATLYDLAARNVLTRGVPYRDVFDTNLPGMVWLHVLVRTLLGWSSEALRLADLLAFAGVVALLGRWLARAGLGLTACGWLAVALCAFYFSLSELCHCQRDTWMLLPALAALELRQRRFDSGHTEVVSAFLEGALWAAAFWVKPFVGVPAVACWLASFAAGGRKILGDTAAVVAGSAVVLAAGLAWLMASGAWPHFWDVFLRWNPEYLSNSAGLMRRTRFLIRAFVPWSLIHLVAVPLAVRGLIRGPKDAFPAAFYLGWLIQAAYVQKGFDYILASAVPPALALLAPLLARSASEGVPRSRFGLVTCVLVAFVAVAAYRHPLTRHDRLSAWPLCWREGSSAEVRDRLKLVTDRNAPDWSDLARVADYLCGQGVRDGDVTCYNNSTHPLYLMMGMRPSTRVLHYDTILMCFPSRREEVRRMLDASGHRYVVSDLRAAPSSLPEDSRGAFPWSLPAAFRAGRYLVHEAPAGVGPLVTR